MNKPHDIQKLEKALTFVLDGGTCVNAEKKYGVDHSLLSKYLKYPFNPKGLDRFWNLSRSIQNRIIGRLREDKINKDNLWEIFLRKYYGIGHSSKLRSNG